MSDPAIELNGIWKKFAKGEKYDSLRDLVPSMVKRLLTGNHRGELERREFWALKDVSFQVNRGEALGIIGRNGSGKSTTLKLLSGILAPTRGSLNVNGRLSALIEVGAGFHPDLTGRENIYLNGAIMGMKKREIDRRFDEIVEFSELEEFLDTPVKRYSSGMYARLGFSVAAHLDSDILLVDEVLSVGDIAFQAKCMERIKQLQRAGTTIVFISHNMDAMLQLCPRVILLQHGVIAKDGMASEVVDLYRVRASWHPDWRDVPQTESDVTVRKFIFLDQKDREVSAFQRGDGFKIKILLEAFHRIPNPILGVSFYNEKGICVYGHNSRMDRYEIGDLEGEIHFELEYGAVHLQPGQYWVSVAVAETSGVRPYLCRDKAFAFTIEGPRSEEFGVVHLPHVWKRCE